MQWVIDIDRTICGGNASVAFGAFHNRDLHLGISEEILASLTTYADLVRLPEVRAFWQAHPQEWNASRHWAIADPEVLRSFTPEPGAVDGVYELARRGPLFYLSARPSQMQEVTQQWLEHCGFPASDQAVCVKSIDYKISYLAGLPEEPITVIDDRGHTHFMKALERAQTPLHLIILVHHSLLLAPCLRSQLGRICVDVLALLERGYLSSL